LTFFVVHHGLRLAISRSGDMRTFSRWIIVLCASPAGVIVLAALDSTLFFSLPFGIDAAVILLAARLRDMWWIVPLIATA